MPQAAASVSPQDVLSQLAAFARLVEPTLARKSYYELLNLPRDAPLPAVRKAYYAVAAQLHPDRYAGMTDAEAREKLETIYARVAEAYRVLANPDLRARYDEGLARGQLRLLTTARERKGPRAPEDDLRNADARRLFRLGLLARERGDWRAALLNFNLAQGYEGEAPLLRQAIADAQAALASAKISGSRV